MTSKCDDLRRNLSAAEAQERTLKATARKAEAGAKELKEQMQRMKSTLEQVRSKCQGDIRKRDLELEKLKNHLVNLQRGKRDGTGMNLISVAPHLREAKAVPDMNSPDYSLEQETNTFLASMVKGLNADLESLGGEHKWLVYLIRRTKQELEDMLSGDSEEATDLGLGLSSKQKILPPPCPSTQMYGDLAVEMNSILEHCGAILNNPSYVSIEEVEIRENEIIKLREGWEKMAGRLREALTMMETWRRRMIDGGQTVNIEELGKGMDLGKSIAVTSRFGQNDSGIDPASASLFDEEQEEEELDDDEKLFGKSIEYESTKAGPELEQTENDNKDAISMKCPQSTTFDDAEPARKKRYSSIPKLQQRPHLTASPARRFPMPKHQEEHPTAPLAETTTNITRQSPSKKQYQHQQSPRKVSFPDNFDTKLAQQEQADENDDDDLDFDELLAQEAARAAKTTSKTTSSAPSKPLTIPEKLALVQVEAEEEAKAEAEAEKGKKRKRDVGAATGGTRRGRTKRDRRRSTLAPEELEELMGKH